MQPIKYQIFVSSTYDDLKAERDQIIKASLEMGHIPVGMEMFSAADEEQWKIIARQIDQSDYYAVIVAHRYGSMAGAISYTEKEYNYAKKQGVPIIGFVIKPGASWPGDRTETDAKKRVLLEKFKSKIKAKPAGFWSTAEELHGKFAVALGKLITTNPRPGWVRASDTAGPQVLTELSRLSSENAELRSKSQPEPLYHGLTFRELHDLLNQPITSFGSFPQELAQTLMNVRDRYGAAEPSRLHYFVIVAEDILTGNDYYLMSGIHDDVAPFFSLGLIVQGIRAASNHSLSEAFYTLTESGQRFLNKLIRLGEAGLPTDHDL